MRELSCREIEEAVERLCVKAGTMLPPETAMLIECASEEEESPAGRKALGDMLEHVFRAGLNGLPICRDAGITAVFADIGQEVHITGGSFEEAANRGVRRAREKLSLAAGPAAEPLKNENAGDFAPAVIHARIVPGDNIILTVSLRDFEAESMGAAKIFPPGAAADDILDFLAQAVERARPRESFPVILGVGLGGTLEQAALLAKRALIRPMDKRNPDPFYARLERKALARVNGLGIGPGGLGGSTTALAVNIEAFPARAEGLPCVVNVSGYAARRAEAVL